MINFQETIFDLAFKGAFEPLKSKIEENENSINSRDSVSLYFLTQLGCIIPINDLQTFFYILE